MAIYQSDIPQGNSDEEILERIRARYTLCEEAYVDIHKDAKEDIKFCKGEQWPDDVKTARQLDKRPCLTINLLPERIRQVTNEQRQNRPAIKVNPVDDEADVETAEVLQGLIRHIEYASNAEIAYDRASDGQVRGGFGYFRLVTDYCSPTDFNQEIQVKSVLDPFSVMLDPNSNEPDGSDSEYGFIMSTMSKEQYQREFPDSNVGQATDWGSIASSSAGWMNKDDIRVCEYYEKQYHKTKIFKLSDGRVVQADDLQDEHLMGLSRDGIVPQIVNQRWTEICEVKWYKTNGTEILDRTDIHGTYIPIIPVLGDEYYLEGRKTYESIVRHAKDSQRMYNYWKTAATEMIALAPRAPFIGVEGQFEDFEDQWKMANNKSLAFLQYKQVTLSNGQPAPPPERNQYEPPVQAINMQSVSCVEDIKATTGVQDAEIGKVSQEVSGVAIQRRINQSNTSNFHFGDNFKRSLRHAGCIILEWIPKVYNTPQAIRVLGTDDEQKIVKINQIFQEAGEDKAYYLGKGEYDVTIDTGPSYQTRRQEAVAGLLDLTKALPNTMQFAADLVVRNMDIPDSQKLADRIKKTLPPGIAEPDGEQKPVPPEAQQAISQLTQQVQQQHALLMQQDKLIQGKQAEIESREKIEAMKLKTDMVLEMMKHDVAGAKLMMDAEISEITAVLEHQRNLELKNVAGPATGAAPDNNIPTGG